MYGFVDPKSRGYNRNLASEALFWNGIVLDNEISGFRTLTVEGRESINYEINKLARPQDGDVELGSSLAGKVIKVRFLLETKNSRDFNQSWYMLKSIVSGSKKRFTFADEPNEYRFGTVQAISNELVGTYTTTGVIEIYQSDPFVYNEEVIRTIKADGSKPFIFDDMDIIMPIRTVDISTVFNVDVGAPKLVFTQPNGNTYTLQCTLAVKAGDRFTFNQSNGRGYLNGKYTPNSISISSDMGSFKLVTGTRMENSALLFRELRFKYNNKRV